MKLIRISTLLCSLFFLITSCTKELSLENDGIAVGPGGGTSEAILLGAPGECTGIEVFGSYPKGIAVDTGSYVTVLLDVTKEGTYGISTDTVNGIYFSGVGNFGAQGSGLAVLSAKGIPAALGTFTYKVKFKGSACSFSINVADAVVGTSGDYFPLTANSFWVYRSADPLAGTDDTIRNSALGISRTIAGQQYTPFKISNSFVDDSAYYRKGGGEYRQYADIDVAGLSDTEVNTEYIFLKDNVTAGTEWFSAEGNGTAAGTTFKIRLKMTMLSKNANASAGGKLYVDVIKIRTIQQVQLTAGVWSDVVSVEYWFAKGIGLINVVAPAPAYGYFLTNFKVN